MCMHMFVYAYVYMHMYVFAYVCICICMYMTEYLEDQVQVISCDKLTILVLLSVYMSQGASEPLIEY